MVSVEGAGLGDPANGCSVAGATAGLGSPFFSVTGEGVAVWAGVEFVSVFSSFCAAGGAADDGRASVVADVGGTGVVTGGAIATGAAFLCEGKPGGGSPVQRIARMVTSGANDSGLKVLTVVSVGAF